MDRKIKIVIIGSAGSGKTTLANILGDRLGVHVFKTDDYRYYPGTWNKKPYEEFVTSMKTDIGTLDSWIIEGSFYDAHDSQNTRVKQMIEFISVCDLLICFREDKIRLIESLMKRCHQRMSDDGKGGSAVETYQSQAKLLTKAIETHEISNTVHGVLLDMISVLYPHLKTVCGSRTEIYSELKI